MCWSLINTISIESAVDLHITSNIISPSPSTPALFVQQIEVTWALIQSSFYLTVFLHNPWMPRIIQKAFNK